MLAPRRRPSTALVCGLLLTLCHGAACRRGDDARVRDTAGVLAEEQLGSIAAYLEFVESRRGVDTRVVVIDELAADLAGQAVSRFERLQVGSANAGQGLLLLINVADREARVEVGYGLEHRVRDVEASSMITEFLAPYFSSGRAAAGIEASVERLVDVLEPSRGDVLEGEPVLGSGGAGAAADLFAGIDRLTPEIEARLREILVPQARPEDCVRLEMELMHRGIYYRDVPMYDAAWRRANRPDFPAARLKSIAREWDGPFEVASTGDYAITYFVGEKGRRWGPQFLRRTEAGWIVDASLVARHIVYDYSNRYWYAVEDDYPYLELVKRVYGMERVRLGDGRAAWMIDSTP